MVLHKLRYRELCDKNEGVRCVWIKSSILKAARLVQNIVREQYILVRLEQYFEQKPSIIIERKLQNYHR
jgi:hypothetical protein